MATNTMNPTSAGTQSPQLHLNDFLQADWTQTETSNVKVMIDFVQHLMNDHDFAYIEENFGHHRYVQHNRSMEDSIAGVLGVVKNTVKRFPDYCYDVKRIIASGDYVVFHSHVTLNAKHRGNEKKGLLISDTWRIKDGELVEHWDVLQSLNFSLRLLSFLTGGKIRNSNGLF